MLSFQVIVTLVVFPNSFPLHSFALPAGGELQYQEEQSEELVVLHLPLTQLVTIAVCVLTAAPHSGTFSRHVNISMSKPEAADHAQPGAAADDTQPQSTVIGVIATVTLFPLICICSLDTRLIDLRFLDVFLDPPGPSCL